MKKYLIFVAGFISGIVFMIIVALIIAGSSSKKSGISNIEGLTIFEQANDSPYHTFEIFQVIDNGVALANAYILSYDIVSQSAAFGIASPRQLVLLVNDEGLYYYDEQVIMVPDDKCVRQIGVYKYTTKSELEKTVPVVKVMDK